MPNGEKLASLMGHDGWASDPYVLPSKPSLPADPTLALASTTSSESADEPVLSGAVAGGSLQNNIDLSGQTNPPDPTRNFNGPLVDNGADGNVRVPIEYMGIQNDSIHLGVNSFVPVPPWNFPYMEDYPSFQVPDDFSAKTITETDSFSTYLMYKADMQGSVWIALSEIDWSWTATATNNGTAQNPQWTGPDSSKQPQPTGPTTPAGAKAFPTWVNNVRNYGDAVKNPWRLGT